MYVGDVEELYIISKLDLNPSVILPQLCVSKVVILVIFLTFWNFKKNVLCGGRCEDVEVLVSCRMENEQLWLFLQTRDVPEKKNGKLQCFFFH